MYLIQDATESLWLHRQNGFTAAPLIRYLEFWGVMQSVTIQQDAIKEIHEVIVSKRLDPRSLGLQAWMDITELRNVCAGHPAKKDRRGPLVRTFMPRDFGGYDRITYERWEQTTGTSYPQVPLGKMLDDYAAEAAAMLSTVLGAMKVRWP